MIIVSLYPVSGPIKGGFSLEASGGSARHRDDGRAVWTHHTVGRHSPMRSVTGWRRCSPRSWPRPEAGRTTTEQREAVIAMSAITEDTSTQTVAARLANWVVDLTFDELPADVVELACRLVLDQSGLQLRGATLPNVAPVRAVAQRLAGSPDCTVTGATWRTTAPHAAWVNGTMGHSCEYDDAHMRAAHATSTVISTSFAFGEHLGKSGRDVVTAIVAGQQVMSLLGSVAMPGMQDAGWHISKVLGVYGAAAAAGRLLGLDATQLRNAFGIAGSDAGGTMEYDRSGGEVKRLHSGSAARVGGEAALLAQSGYSGPSTIFDGPRGLFAMFAHESSTDRLDEFWGTWQIRDTMFRLFPAVATIHSPTAAAVRLVTDHGIDWRQVRSIRVGLDELSFGHGASIVHPKDAISAQFSLAHSIALALVRRSNRVTDYFDVAGYTDPDIAAVAETVEPYVMPIPDNDPIFSSDVAITMADGTLYRHYERGFPGHITNRATFAQVLAKFRDNVEGILDAKRTDDLIGLAADLPNQPDLTALEAILAG
jgi:2-methylcitrate dehydratase PrpD